jgi:subtilase family serine protease
MGRFQGTNRLNLAIGLPLRNEEALDNLLQQIYDPASPNFRQYLTPEQFTEMFGPTEQDYQAVIDFAKTNGLTVTGMSANRVLLDVSGSVADIEKAFQVTMRTYRHPKENRMFYAPDAEPSVDVAVPILHVSGLDNFELPHPKLKIEPATQTAGMTPRAY